MEIIRKTESKIGLEIHKKLQNEQRLSFKFVNLKQNQISTGNGIIAQENEWLPEREREREREVLKTQLKTAVLRKKKKKKPN